MTQLIIHTDGGARGNPGPAAIGVVIKTETGIVLNLISRTIGQTTNNVAEYSAVVAALEWVKDNRQQITNPPAGKIGNKEQSIHFFLDSTLVVNQLNGLWKMKDATLRELIVKIRILEAEIGLPVYYAYIPREKNFEADSQVNKALDSPSS